MVTEPERRLTGVSDHGVSWIAPNVRVRSTDYGPGTIVLDLSPIGVQILWDQPMLEGVAGPQLLTHDRGWVERLERL